jgi:hypothetical protein
VASLRQRIDELDREIAAGMERLPLISEKLLAGFQAMLEGKQEERDRKDAELRLALEGAECEELKTLEEELQAAEEWLRRLREAILADEPSLIRAVLKQFVTKVELFFTHKGIGPAESKTRKPGRKQKIGCKLKFGRIYLRCDLRLVRPGNDGPPIFMEYPSQKVPPVLGEKQSDPTHSAVLGLKLAEKLKSVGVEVVPVYPDKTDPRYKNSAAFLIERLKK